MLTDPIRRTNQLVSEYIHTEIDWQVSDVVRIHSTIATPAADLEILRRQHFSRLKRDREFGEKLELWMKNPDQIPQASCGRENITLTLCDKEGIL